MRNKFLPFSPPLIEDDEINEVIHTLRSDWITTGPKVKQFEKEFADFTGAPSALAVSSATDALQLSLAAFDVGAGDEVITTTFTFCSTIHVIEHIGAKPVLVDIEEKTLTIHPDMVIQKINKKTKAIIPVHIYGHPCRMDELTDIARKYSLILIEDAAHALPSYHNGRLIGSPIKGIRWASCFSFYATKNITTAEGGMITGEESFIDKARIWSLHGMSKDAWKRYSGSGSWHYEVVVPGFKCNMTDIQASIGIHQLKKLLKFQKRRREIAEMYNSAFANIPELELPHVRTDCEHSWHIYAIRLNLNMLSINRDQFIDELLKRNIGASVHFIPNHIQPYYRNKYGYKPEDFPVAWREYFRLISLPIYPRMSNDDVNDVIEAVLDIVNKHKR
ncbi:MAG: DegT/DnrJ/EryC1/StrS family aminotransferase [Candidatus Aminicenantes bacterium]|nr:DegT/DnrJ/EryC1/StrS family aminotransferase [Candidatus Aminicenantes bacterium]